MESMKQSIKSTLPNDKGELSWIIDNIGIVLFNEDWSEFRPPQLVDNKISNTGSGIIETIDKCFKDSSDKNVLINHLFTESLNKLLNKS